MTKDEFQKAVDDAITDCIRNDYSFGSYACKVTDVVWPVLEAAEKERDALRAKIAAMEKQEPVAQVGVHKTGGNAGIAWSARPLNDFDSLPLMRDGDRLYALPGAQDVPKEAIAKLLTEAMDIAVSNGADSRSMPDEYVEVAAWLCGIPAQNEPSVPEAKP